MAHAPKAGNYRKLFKMGLDDLIASGKLSKEDRKDAIIYRAMLDDLAYKFGRPEGFSQEYWKPGELFTRS